MSDEMQLRRSTGARLLAIALLAAFAAACSGPAATAAPAGPTVVNVTLGEWSVAPSVTTAKAGKVTFNASNAGPADAHELVIVKTDLGLLDLPTGADGKVDEEGAGLDMIGEIEEFAVGATGTVTFDLAAGNYLLICNIVDAEGDAHYGKGMSAKFTVN